MIIDLRGRLLMNNTQDYLIKALALNDEVRVYIVRNTQTVNEAITRHDLWPTAASVLGKTLTMGQIMGAMLKGNQALTIKINGKGQLGNIIVDAYSNGNARAYVDNPHVSILNNKGIDDRYGIGTDGYLDVIKDLKLKDLFTSSIALSGDLAYDFAYYFLESEQTRTALLFALKINTDHTCLVSGGILFQLLPQASEEAIIYLEKVLKDYRDLSIVLDKNDLKDILEMIFGNDFKIIEKMPVGFRCPCSKEHFRRGLKLLGKKELNKLASEEENIEIVCHYCNNRYNFSKADILKIIKGENDD